MNKKTILTLLLLCNILVTFGQRPKPDVFDGRKGELTIQPILHGTLLLQHNDHIIYIDPYGGEKAFEGMAKPNLILITDIHGDHLNENTLDALDTKGVQMIVPQAVADQISEKYQEQLIILANGERHKMLDMKIQAIPMYNLPESDQAKHIKGRGNGYLLHIANKKVYISGDTADITEMRELKDIDIAFVCMNLPYTMNIEQAASAVLDFKPKVVYPYHYRGKPDISDTKAFKKLVNDKNDNIEVRLRNWYPAYE